MVKILGLVLTAGCVLGIEPVPEKDVYLSEGSRMGLGKKMEMMDEFPPEPSFRYEGMRKAPIKGGRNMNRRGDMFYVVPTNQLPKSRTPKR